MQVRQDAWGYGYAAGLTRQQAMGWAPQHPAQCVPLPMPRPGMPLLQPSRGLPPPPPPAAPPKSKLGALLVPLICFSRLFLLPSHLTHFGDPNHVSHLQLRVVLFAVLGVKRKFEPGCGGPTKAGFPPRQVCTHEDDQM